MRRTHKAMVIVVAGLALAGCAERVEVGAQGPRTITVGHDATGTTVRLNVGDRLVVDLGPAFALVRLGGQRAVVDVPSDILRSDGGDRMEGEYGFVATDQGSGRLVIVSFGADCGPPVAVAGIQCPVTQGGTDSGPPTLTPLPTGAKPPRNVFELDVVVE